MGPLFESPPRPLLKSGLQPLGRYGTHQETIGMRHEQMYPLSDTRLEWLGEESLFELNSNKCWGPIRGHYSSHLLVEVRPAALGQIWHSPGIHKYM